MVKRADNIKVQCLVAPNSGPMTGGGTNTWIIGDGPYLVIDPGPNIASHLEAIKTVVGNDLAAIFVTHTHRDHSPAAVPLGKWANAPIYGKSLEIDDGNQDSSITFSSELADRVYYRFDDLEIQAISTPGHVDNHFCFYLPQRQMMFTGDHMMSGSTVVIIPPSGHMGRYLESLRKILTFQMDKIAPGHGELIDHPHREIENLIQHRLGREAKVLSAVMYDRSRNLDELTELVYADIPRSLLPIAKFSLLAHLIKLEEEGFIVKLIGRHWLADEDSWQRV